MNIQAIHKIMKADGDEAKADYLYLAIKRAFIAGLTTMEEKQNNYN